MITPRLIPQKTDKSTPEEIASKNVREKAFLTHGRPRRASTELANRLAHVLEAHRGERHLIVLHSFPDPDAISSAYAHRLLSREFDIETDITYCGKISHQQNIALVRLSGIELVPYDQIMDLSSYDGAVYVDNQGTTCWLGKETRPRSLGESPSTINQCASELQPKKGNPFRAKSFYLVILPQYSAILFCAFQ